MILKGEDVGYLEDETGKRQPVTKGVVEELLSICKYAEYEGK